MVSATAVGSISSPMLVRLLHGQYRLAGGENRVLLLHAPEHVDRDVGLQGIDHEAVGRIDRLFVAQIEDGEFFMHRRAALDLFLGKLCVLVVARHARASGGCRISSMP